MNKQSPPHLSHVTFICVGTFGCWDRCGGYMPMKNVALVQINPAYTFVFTLLCSLIDQQHLESKFAQNMTPPTRFLALQIFCVVCWLFFFLFFARIVFPFAQRFVFISFLTACYKKKLNYSKIWLSRVLRRWQLVTKTAVCFYLSLISHARVINLWSRFSVFFFFTIATFITIIVTIIIIIIITNIFLLSWERSYAVFLNFHRLQNSSINNCQFTCHLVAMYFSWDLLLP